MTSRAPTFTVGDVPVYGDVVLAPMAGYTEPPYRRLCYEFGSAMSYTELLDAKALHYRTAHERTLSMLAFGPEEHPRVAQIFGTDEGMLAAGAVAFVVEGAEVIDLNLGCSVPKITSNGAGAALLRHPERIAGIITALNAAVDVPVTAKIRLGWDAEHRNYLEVTRALEESGAALVAVHGRTAAQGYDEPADWDAIAEVKAAARVPVIGNGDVKEVADVARMKAHTGCDAVMIGRAAMGNPWIFAGRDLEEVPLAERVAVMRRHLRLLVEHHEPRRGVLHFRKHLGRYLRGVPGCGHMRRELVELRSPEALHQALAELATLPPARCG